MAYINHVYNRATECQRVEDAYQSLKGQGMASAMVSIWTIIPSILPFSLTASEKAALRNFVRDDGTNFGDTHRSKRDSRTTYRYQKLPLDVRSSSFRLLKLRPLKEDERIHCSLEVHTFATCPAYEALSYCWGNAPADVAISCDGVDLMVTKTVASAISRLRLMGCRYLWLDAVCINQEDVDEREAQVRIMQHTYSGASRVWVWLGGESFHQASGFFSRKTFDLLRAYADGTADLAKARPKSSRRYARQIAEHKRREADKDVQALEVLLQSPWFDRIWVVQEVAVASKVTLLCGPHTMGWPTFHQGLSNVVRRRKNCSQTFGALQQPSLMWRRVNHLSIEEECLVCQELASYLLTLLTKFRSRHATDPRDKVYGLVGLVSDRFGCCDLALSYRESVAQVYETTAVYILRAANSLDILEACALGRPGQEALEAPSWVPDWRQHDLVPTPLKRRTARGGKTFAAAASAAYECTFQRKAHLLGLKGEIVDELVTVGETLPMEKMRGGHCDWNEYMTWWYTLSKSQASSPEQFHLVQAAVGTRSPNGGSEHHTSDIDFKKVLDHFNLGLHDDYTRTHLAEVMDQKFKLRPKWMETLSGERVKSVLQQVKVLEQWEKISRRDDSRIRYPTGESRWSAYWQTLAAGNLLRGGHCGTANCFERWDKSLDGMRTLAAAGVDSWKTEVAGAAYLALPQSFIGWNQEQPFSELLDHAYNRCFARSKKGYYCLAPPGARERDSVAIVNGGDLPLIIRPSGNEWILVGVAYVHGIMYGEAYSGERCERFWFR